MVQEQFVYASKNPGVFTDARCYMHWIAIQFGMRMPENYKLPSSCGESRGRKNDIDQTICRVRTDHYIEKQRFYPCHPDLCKLCKVNSTLQTQVSNMTEKNTRPNCKNVENFSLACRDGIIHGCFEDERKHVTKGFCDWGQKDADGKRWDKCRPVAAEGFSYNVFQCKDRYGVLGTCSNNCRGVDPNAIIIGGSAVLAAAGGGGLSILQAAGLGGIRLGAVAVGGASMLVNNAGCPNTRPCRVRHCFHLLKNYVDCQFLCLCFQRTCLRNRRRTACCRQIGSNNGPRCPRFCSDC